MTSRTPSGHARLLERDLLRQRAGGVADVAHDLLDEERVALGLAGERAHEGLARRARTASSATSSATSGSARPVELQPPQRALAAQVADQLVQRVAVGDLALAVGAEEQHPPRRGRAHEVAQQLQRRPVGPVQVVEDEHDRRLGADLADQRGDGVEEAEALRVGLGAGDRPSVVVGAAAGRTPAAGSPSSAARGPSRSRSASSGAPADQPRSISTTGWYGVSVSSSKRP